MPEIRDTQFYRTLVENSADVVLVVGEDSRVFFSAHDDLQIIGMPGVNPVGTSLLDYVGEPYVDAMQEWLQRVVAEHQTSHRFEFESRARVPGGQHLVAIATNLCAHPAVQGIVVSLRDVTVRKRAENEVRQMAMYDGLTGLARRDFFTEQMRKAVAHAVRHNEVLAIMFVDIDGFKAVNDKLGHAVGDRMLKEVGARLRDALREDDTIGRAVLMENEHRISRIGGDEFIVMLTKLTEAGNSRLVAQRMLDAVAVPYSVAGDDVVVTLSIGIAVFPQDGRSAEELIKSADAAMYVAKKEGKNAYRFHSPV